MLHTSAPWHVPTNPACRQNSVGTHSNHNNQKMKEREGEKKVFIAWGHEDSFSFFEWVGLKTNHYRNTCLPLTLKYESCLIHPSIPLKTKKSKDSVDAFLVGKGFQRGRLFAQSWPGWFDQIKWNVRTRNLQKVELKSGAEAAYMDVLTKD